MSRINIADENPVLALLLSRLHYLTSIKKAITLKIYIRYCGFGRHRPKSPHLLLILLLQKSIPSCPLPPPPSTNPPTIPSPRLPGHQTPLPAPKSPVVTLGPTHRRRGRQSRYRAPASPSLPSTKVVVARGV